MIPVLRPSFQLTGLVPDEVFVGFNLCKTLSVSLLFGKSNAFRLQQTFAKPNSQFAQFSLTLRTNLPNVSAAIPPPCRDYSPLDCKRQANRILASTAVLW